VNEAKTNGVRRGEIIGVAVGPPGTRLNRGVNLSDDFDLL
jgi:hypothetical protein